MFYFYPRQNFGSTSPLFSKYTSSPRVRLCIRRTTGRCYRNSESDRSGAWDQPHLRILGLSKNVDNSKQIRFRYAGICIPLAVSLSNGRRLTELRDLVTTMIRKEGLYLGSRWSQATRRGRRSGPPRDSGSARHSTPLRRAPLCIKRNTRAQLKISTEPPLHGEVSNTCKQSTRHDGRQSHPGHDGRQ